MGDKSSFLSAIRGPIMMIAIGVLFAVDYSAGVPFRTTWPVILIVAGLLHLFGRRGYRNMPSANPAGPGTGVQGTGVPGTNLQGTEIR
jgi:hypothetical protein